MVNIIGDSSNPGIAGVEGGNDAAGADVFGRGRRGVVGISREYQGVFGKCRDNSGVVGESDHTHG
jgi:hypothetical protein